MGCERRMIRSPLKAILLCVVFWGLLLAGASAGEWKPYQATREGDIYYFDRESIERLPEGILRVWVRMEKTDYQGGDLKKYVDEIVSGKKGKVTGEVVQLLEINCPKGMFRVINLVEYDRNRDIKRYFNVPSEWNKIPPESVTNFLSKEVCR